MSADHVHLHVSYPPKHALSDVIRKIKGRSARKLLQEYPSLKRRYWGGHFWGIGYGARSTGQITDAIVDEYLEHHRRGGSPNGPENFILE